MSLCSNLRCRQSLPSQAHYCPKCGTQVARSGASFAFILAIGITIFVILMGVMFAGMARSSNRVVFPAGNHVLIR